MKRLFALILGGLMVFSLAACGQEQEKNNNSVQDDTSQVVLGEDENTWGPEDNTEAEDAVAGGWEKAETPAITDEIKSLVEKATESLIGANYTPVAYIGSQVVAGTNHLVLCKVEATSPEAAAEYVLVTIYEDLEGNAEITEILDSNAEAGTADLSGGWNEPESPALTEDATKALDKATEGLLGASYAPVALLGTQVVSGTNYSILCETVATSPEAEPTYSIVTVFEDLEGNAEITETFDFTATE